MKNISTDNNYSLEDGSRASSQNTRVIPKVRSPMFKNIK
jgi:hypothetical protein